MNTFTSESATKGDDMTIDRTFKTSERNFKTGIERARMRAELIRSFLDPVFRAVIGKKFRLNLKGQPIERTEHKINAGWQLPLTVTSEQR